MAGLLLMASRNVRAEWVFQDSHSPRTSFRAVHALNARVVWVGGTGGSCLRTVDGGKTWEKLAIPGAEKLDFRSIVAFDERTAVCASAGDAEAGMTRIFRTADGGKTWQLAFQSWEQGAFLDGVSFWDRENGLALGDPIGGKWYLLKTVDGGRTWQRFWPKDIPATLPNEGAFAAGNSSMQMQGSSRVWIGSGAAERARVFFSSDRGQTWRVVETPMPSGTTSGIFGMRFWDSRHGIAVGGDYKKETGASDNVILTDDAGKTWRKGAATTPPSFKETVVMLPGNLLLALGPAGTSSSRDFGKTWQFSDTNSFHAASCAEGNCWAVGGRGAIARWNGAK